MVRRPPKSAIDVSIPAANDTGAEDQEPMRLNFVSIKSFVTVDHVEPGIAKEGKHKQITFEGYHPPARPLDPVSVAYTNVGRVDPSHPQHYWRSSQGIFPLSSVRAFGVFKVLITPGPNNTLKKTEQSIVSKFNLESIEYKENVTLPGQGSARYLKFDIKVKANAVFESKPIILLNFNTMVTPLNRPYAHTYTEDVLSVYLRFVDFSNVTTQFSVLLQQS